MKNLAKKIMIFKAKSIDSQNTSCQDYYSKRIKKMTKKIMIDLLLNDKRKQNQKVRNWFIISMMNLNMN